MSINTLCSNPTILSNLADCIAPLLPTPLDYTIVRDVASPEWIELLNFLTYDTPADAPDILAVENDTQGLIQYSTSVFQFGLNFIVDASGNNQTSFEIFCDLPIVFTNPNMNYTQLCSVPVINNTTGKSTLATAWYNGVNNTLDPTAPLANCVCIFGSWTSAMATGDSITIGTPSFIFPVV